MDVANYAAILLTGATGSRNDTRARTHTSVGVSANAQPQCTRCYNEIIIGPNQV